MHEANPKRVVIVKRQRVNHLTHHGGSWKVAYADFMTAMTAFFMGRPTTRVM